MAAVEAQCVLTGAGLIIGQLVTRHLESGIRAACDRFDSDLQPLIMPRTN
jgi:hypothetical protein